jgi:hypothetical protein
VSFGFGANELLEMELNLLTFWIEAVGELDQQQRAANEAPITGMH